jgi:hypothetical protein
VGSTGHIAHSGVSRARNIDALFFLLRWARCGFHKQHIGTRYAELVFWHPVGSAGNVVHSGASGPRNVDALFFILRWAWCSFHKKRAGTRDAEHVFFHLVGSAGHVVYSDVSGPRNIDALFFKLGWAWSSFEKKCVRTHYTEHVILHPVGSAGTQCILVRPGREILTHYFLCFGGSGAVSINSTPGHDTPNMCVLCLMGSTGHIEQSGAPRL